MSEMQKAKCLLWYHSFRSCGYTAKESLLWSLVQNQQW